MQDSVNIPLAAKIVGSGYRFLGQEARLYDFCPTLISYVGSRRGRKVDCPQKQILIAYSVVMAFFRCYVIFTLPIRLNPAWVQFSRCQTFVNETIFVLPTSWPDLSANYTPSMLLGQNSEQDISTLPVNLSRFAPDVIRFSIFKCSNLSRSWKQISKANNMHRHFTRDIMSRATSYELAQSFRDV